MHRLKFEKNKKQKTDGEGPLRELPKLCDYLNLIGGTGTGGIIALMLGRLQMDVHMAIKHYNDLVKQVFSDMKQWGENRKTQAMKLEGVIKSVVKTITGDPKTLLLEGDQAGVCRTFICAMNVHNMNANIPHLFRTYQSREMPFDCKIWEATQATSAMSIFFEHIEIGRAQPFIDGGLGCNNPSQLVLDEDQLGKQGLDWSWDFGQVIECLGSYSFIEYDHQDDTYSIHPLVQHWSRTTIKGNRQVMQKCILAIISLSISWTFNEEDYKYCRTVVQHISNSRASLKLEEINAFILRRLGLVYNEQGRWTDAEALKVMVMEKTKWVLGDDHSDTLTSMGNLASTYRNLGWWTDAEALEVVVMEKTKRVPGDDHPDTLTSVGNLASTYRNLERWMDAEALKVVVMEKMKQVLGMF